MESLELIDDIKFKYDTKGVNLYYDKFNYRYITKFNGIGRFRYVSNEEQFEKRLNQSLHSWYGSNNKSNVTVWDLLLNENVNINDLRKFVKWRNIYKSNIKLLITVDKLSIFFNDKSIIEQFLTIFPDKKVHYSANYRTRIPNFEKDVVYQVNPQYKFRLKLNSLALDLDGLVEFKNTLIAANIKPSPALEKRMNRHLDVGHSYGLSKFILYYDSFLDLTNDSLITLLALKYPEIIKKVYRIEQR